MTQLHDCGFRIADCGLKIVTILAIRNPQSEIAFFEMDPDQQRIEEDLRGLCKATFAATTSSRSSTRATPASTSCGRWASCGRDRWTTWSRSFATRRRIICRFIARGAGTGLAGESLGRGLVVDFSRYFRRIVADEGDRVRVQPGVVLENR